MAKKASKISSDENKALMSSKIATDTAVYMAAGGTVKHCTHRDNANFTYVKKKSRKQQLEDQKRSGLLSVTNSWQRK